MELVGDILVFKAEDFSVFGRVKPEEISIVEKELQISHKPELTHKSLLCRIYQTDRYRIIYDLVKGSSVCFHASNLYRIDLV